MLAFMPESEVEQYLATEKLVKCTDYTLTNPQHISDHLVEIRRNFYAVDNMEHEYGVRCVGMPLFDNKENIVGAISVQRHIIL